MSLWINYNRCIKTGNCYRDFPELFKEKDDSFPEVLNADPEGDAHDDATWARSNCPGYSVRLGEDDTEQVVPDQVMSKVREFI